MEQQKIKRGFFRNFVYAGRGIQSFFSTERNGRIQGLMALLVIASGLLLHLSRIDWCIIFICIALVITLEMINSAIEKLCDIISPNYHPAIKVIKDISAGAVLIASIVAAIIGCVIFLPYINKLF